MARVATTLRQWCRACQRVTENAACPLGCGLVICAGCGSHGVDPCPEAADDD